LRQRHSMAAPAHQLHFTGAGLTSADQLVDPDIGNGHGVSGLTPSREAILTFPSHCVLALTSSLGGFLPSSEAAGIRQSVCASVIATALAVHGDLPIISCLWRPLADHTAPSVPQH